MRRKMIYVVLDVVAGEAVGSVLQMLPHDAVAVRSFSDILQLESFRPHAADYELVCVGELVDVDRKVVPEWRVVVTGATLVAATQGVSDAPA